MSQRNSFIIFGLIILSIFKLPLVVLAQSGSIPPGVDITLDSLMAWGQNLGGFLIILGGILIAIFIIGSGILYLTTGIDPARVAVAKNMLKAAVIGGLVIFGAGMIIATIGGFGQNPFGFF